MIKPTRLFYFGCFIIIVEGIWFGFMMDNILKGLVIGILGVVLFTALDLVSIYIKKHSHYVHNASEVKV